MQRTGFVFVCLVCAGDAEASTNTEQRIGIAARQGGMLLEPPLKTQSNAERQLPSSTNPSHALARLIQASNPASAFNSASVPVAHTTRSAAPRAARTAPVIASSALIPVVHIGLAGALLNKAAAALPGLNAMPSAALLASTGLLSLLNLAAVENKRYAGAKQQIATLRGASERKIPSGLGYPIDEGRMLSEQKEYLARCESWFKLVKLKLLAQFLSLIWMIRAINPASALLGAAAFMASNLAFFLLGGGEFRHEGREHRPVEPKTVKAAQASNAILMVTAILGAISDVASPIRLVSSYIFSAACLMGCIEGLPYTFNSLSALVEKLKNRLKSLLPKSRRVPFLIGLVVATCVKILIFVKLVDVWRKPAAV